MKGGFMWRRRNLLAGLCLVVGLAAGAGLASIWWASGETKTSTSLPTNSIAPSDVPAEALREDIHPLDPALQLARECLAYVQESIVDYECMLVKRERIGNQLADEQEMFLRVRNRKLDDEGVMEKPLSVYLRFTKPAAMKGQQVLWVEGQNKNKLVAKPGGTLGRWTPSIWLAPNGTLAMRGNRYGIDQVGIENLVAELIKKGERDRALDECEVEIVDDKLDGRDCTRIEVRHPKPRDHFDFHIAQIYLDRELKVPIRYAAYAWPAAKGEEPPLIEEYTYRDLQLNVGLTDIHFDPKNPDYGF